MYYTRLLGWQVHITRPGLKGDSQQSLGGLGQVGRGQVGQMGRRPTIQYTCTYTHRLLHAPHTGSHACTSTHTPTHKCLMCSRPWCAHERAASSGSVLEEGRVTSTHGLEGLLARGPWAGYTRVVEYGWCDGSGRNNECLREHTCLYSGMQLERHGIS